MPTDADAFDFGDWKVVKSVPNPWGIVPHTGGGKALTPEARAFMDNLIKQQGAKDPVSRRHHYVPQAYLREWSFDNKRVWTLVVRPAIN